MTLIGLLLFLLLLVFLLVIAAPRRKLEGRSPRGCDDDDDDDDDDCNLRSKPAKVAVEEIEVVLGTRVRCCGVVANLLGISGWPVEEVEVEVGDWADVESKIDTSTEKGTRIIDTHLGSFGSANCRRLFFLRKTPPPRLSCSLAPSLLVHSLERRKGGRGQPVGREEANLLIVESVFCTKWSVVTPYH